MDNFENQIIDAIKKITDLRQRPDVDRIYRTITRDATTNVSLADVQQKIGQMMWSSQLQNNLFQAMDSYYVLSNSIQENNSVCNTVLELFEQKLDPSPPINKTTPCRPLPWMILKTQITPKICRTRLTNNRKCSHALKISLKS